MPRILAIFFLLFYLPLPEPAAASGLEPLTDRYVALALEGNLAPAENLFARINPAISAPNDLELARKYRARFIDRSEYLPPASGDPLVDALILAYRDYWNRVLTGVLSADEGKDFLEASLRLVLIEAGKLDPADPGPDVYELSSKLLDERGFFHLGTPAPPLLDLFLWKEEASRTYRVRLTDRTETVRVTFMSDIRSKGWKDYATLGLVATTGWVEDQRLYCVESAYDRASEAFEISYLKHESRHLADLARFPDLSSTELEYRAKLTELAFASTTAEGLLDDFTRKSSQDPGSPHAFANYRVTRDMYHELFGEQIPGEIFPWRGVNAEAVNAGARKLLQNHTALIQTGNP